MAAFEVDLHRGKAKENMLLKVEWSCLGMPERMMPMTPMRKQM